MKKIPLTQGKFALVDDADYEWLNKWKWYAVKDHNTYYAVRSGRISDPRRGCIGMHRIILNAPRGIQVDHININGLDNRRSNLRLCSRTENDRHQRLNRRNTSGYKGVTRREWKSRISYDAQIQVNNKDIHIGCYRTAVEAANAYDVAALKHHKQFALTNRMLGLLKEPGRCFHALARHRKEG